MEKVNIGIMGVGVYLPTEIMSAKEIAVEMLKKGYIPTSERNFTAPRLTELSQIGIVEPYGKKICQYTRKTVSVYILRDNHE